MHILKALVPALAALFVLPAAHAKYDEVRDKNGEVRPHYRPLIPYMNSVTPQKRAAFTRRSRTAFNQDNALDDIPRILPEKDFEFLKGVVEQRAHALVAFAKDYASGNRRYEKLIPPAVLKRMLARSGELGYTGDLNPEQISFYYGPDIARTEVNGKPQWYFLEDNTGYVGGLGDLNLAYKLISELHPDLIEQLKPNKPQVFFKNLIRRARQEADARGGILALLMSGGETADSESQRIIEIAEQLGVKIIKQGSTEESVRFSEKGMFLEQENQYGTKTSQKVGYVILEDELTWADCSHPAAQIKQIIDLSRLFLDPEYGPRYLQKEVRGLLAHPDASTGLPNLPRLKEILRQVNFWDTETGPYPGLVNAILKGHVGSSYTPGFDFLNDKEFYLYVDDLIRYYLKEEPKITILPTLRFGDEAGRLKQDVFEKTFADVKGYVIKRVDGRGGSSVWVGPHLSRKDVDEVRGLVEENPGAFIAQKYIELSQIGDKIVDLRLISFVDQDGVIVAPTPWGRGAPVDGDGKVNISAKGKEFAVLVANRIPRKKTCEDALIEKRN